MTKIVVKLETGKVAIVTLTNNSTEQSILRDCEAIPGYISHREISEDLLPKDYSLRQFWTDDNPETDTVDIDFEKATIYKKELKLKELNNYYFNSDEVRQITINDYFILSLSSEGRNLIAEQIQGLEQQIKLGNIQEANASFEYFYNGGSVEISLAQLRGLYIFMINTVNTNYGVYKAHIHAINALTTIEAVDNYDFTANYLKNQNLDIE
jgi:hypothetical protein